MSLIDEPAKIEEAIRAILAAHPDISELYGSIAFESAGKDPAWPLLLLSIELIEEPVHDQTTNPFYLIDGEAVIRTRGHTADEALRLVYPTRRAIVSIQSRNLNGYLLTGARIDNIERTFFDPELEVWEKTINFIARASTKPL